MAGGTPALRYDWHSPEGRLKNLAVLLVVMCATAFAQKPDPCAAIDAAKTKTYGFRPSRLTIKDRQVRSVQMDSFWRMAGQDKAAGAACIRQLLIAEKEDGFFLFDGASLLSSLDQSEESTKVVLASLHRADMAEIEPAGYVRFLLRLSIAGADIGPLASRYLQYPTVKAFIPEHAMDLDRDMGALLLYGSMAPEQEDSYLIAALGDKESYARSTAALLLALNMTEPSLKALGTYGGMAELPADSAKVVRSYRTFTPYQSPATPAKFSREEVLAYIAQLPHNQKEFGEAMQRQEAYEKQHPELNVNEKLRDQEMEAAVTKKVQESPPFFGVSGADRFIESAIANLTEADLPAVRDARRRSIQGISDEVLGEYFAYSHIIRGVIDRLDLYKEYRVHWLGVQH
jgi:hypothetical protein